MSNPLRNITKAFDSCPSVALKSIQEEIVSRINKGYGTLKYRPNHTLDMGLGVWLERNIEGQTFTDTEEMNMYRERVGTNINKFEILMKKKSIDLGVI